MAEQTPNEKLIGSSDGAACTEALKRAEGKYDDKVQNTIAQRLASGQPKSTVNPIKGKG